MNATTLDGVGYVSKYIYEKIFNVE